MSFLLLQKRSTSLSVSPRQVPGSNYVLVLFDMYYARYIAMKYPVNCARTCPCPLVRELTFPFSVELSSFRARFELFPEVLRAVNVSMTGVCALLYIDVCAVLVERVCFCVSSLSTYRKAVYSVRPERATCRNVNFRQEHATPRGMEQASSSGEFKYSPRYNNGTTTKNTIRTTVSNITTGVPSFFRKRFDSRFETWVCCLRIWTWETRTRTAFVIALRAFFAD